MAGDRVDTPESGHDREAPLTRALHAPLAEAEQGRGVVTALKQGPVGGQGPVVVTTR